MGVTASSVMRLPIAILIFFLLPTASYSCYPRRLKVAQQQPLTLDNTLLCAECLNMPLCWMCSSQLGKAQRSPDTLQGHYSLWPSPGNSKYHIYWATFRSPSLSLFLSFPLFLSFACCLLHSYFFPLSLLLHLLLLLLLLSFSLTSFLLWWWWWWVLLFLFLFFLFPFTPSSFSSLHTDSSNPV